MSFFSSIFIDKLKLNWKSGLTVALVSIPLSLSLAIASEATPLQGILTAIWAGFVYSFFAGSKYNVVGPAGALSGILAIFSFAHGFNALPLLAIVSGVFIFIAYLLRLDRYLTFIPASALHGFTLGVALTIGLSQLNFALGLTGITKHEKLLDNVVESFRHISDMSPETFFVFLISFLLLFLLSRIAPKIPGAIILAPIGIVMGMMASGGMLNFHLQTLQSTYGDIEMKIFAFPQLDFSMDIVAVSLTVALVAILETLISAKIADGMSGTKEKYARRKEMKALALANIASGLAGGIPATGVFARTALNVRTGATDRVSCMLNSIFTAIICIFLLKFFKYIPLAVIAAILVFIAMRMVEISHYQKVLHRARFEFFVTILVAFITVYDDPMTGIMFGTAIALVLFVEKLSRGQFELVFNNPEKQSLGMVTGDANVIMSTDCKYEDCHTIVYSLKGQLAYLNAQAHIDRFEKKLTRYENVILRFRELYFMDSDGVDAFDEIVEIVERQGKNVYISGVSSSVASILRYSKHYQRLIRTQCVFGKTTQALNALGYGKKGYEERVIESLG